jgi:hypothetical protein
LKLPMPQLSAFRDSEHVVPVGSPGDVHNLLGEKPRLMRQNFRHIATMHPHSQPPVLTRHRKADGLGSLPGFNATSKGGPHRQQSIS